MVFHICAVADRWTSHCHSRESKTSGTLVISELEVRKNIRTLLNSVFIFHLLRGTHFPYLTHSFFSNELMEEVLNARDHAFPFGEPSSYPVLIFPVNIAKVFKLRYQ